MNPNPYVILTVERVPGAKAPEFEGVPVVGRKVVADVENGEVWLCIDGPLALDAMIEDVIRPLASLIGNEAAEGWGMAPVTWIEGKLPDEVQTLDFIRDAALEAARSALGVRLQ